MPRLAPPPHATRVRCLHLCMRPAQLIVTFANESETAVCVDHFLALMRYDEYPIRAVHAVR